MMDGEVRHLRALFASTGALGPHSFTEGVAAALAACMEQDGASNPLYSGAPTIDDSTGKLSLLPRIAYSCSDALGVTLIVVSQPLSTVEATTAPCSPSSESTVGSRSCHRLLSYHHELFRLTLDYRPLTPARATE